MAIYKSGGVFDGAEAALKEEYHFEWEDVIAEHRSVFLRQFQEYC